MTPADDLPLLPPAPEVEASLASPAEPEPVAKTCPQCGSVVPPGTPSVLCPRCLLMLGFESQPGLQQPSTQTYRPRFIAPLPEQLAPYFPQLEILERVGYGGMGVVYKARHRELDRLVALKILRPDFEHDAGFAERFQREARALARLNHPHIVSVYDFGKQGDLYFFLMEFVDGTNLRQVEQTGRLTPHEALSIIPQVCDALQYAHEQGVVHRDIKPENILIGKDGRVRIADFGLAKLAQSSADDADAARPLTGTREVVGTPHYMAPEQVERPADVDHRADIFSLGVVLYEMLTGELPIGRFPLPSRKVEVDFRLDEVVLRALEKEPNQRYQRATEVRSDVEHIRDRPASTPLAQWVSTVAIQAKALFSRLMSHSPGDEQAGATADEPLSREELETRLGIPAVALMLLGGLGMFVGLPMVLAGLNPFSIMTLVGGVLSLLVGLSLKHMQSYRFSAAGTILTLCCFGVFWIASLPIAIWTLLILKRPSARTHFTEVPMGESRIWQSLRAAAVACWDTTQSLGQAAGPRLKQVGVGIAEAVPTAFKKVVAITQRRDLTVGAIFIGLWCLWTIAVGLSLDVVIVALYFKHSGLHIIQTSPELLLIPALAATAGWFSGTVVLLRFCGRLLKATAPLTRRERLSGPTEGLLAMMLISLITSVVLSVIVVNNPFPHINWHPIAGDPFVHSAVTMTLHVIFDVLVLLSLALLHWTERTRLARLVVSISTLLFPALIGLLLTQAESGNLWAPFVPMFMSAPLGCWAMLANREPKQPESNQTVESEKTTVNAKLSTAGE